MWKLLACCSVLLLGSCSPTMNDPIFPPPDQARATLKLEKLLEVLAIGSCNRENQSQGYWSVIQAQEPDLWCWLGDNIYADTEDMSVMAAKYQQQQSASAYAAFRSKVPAIGLWDDHDYGVNDGDKNYPLKEESKNLHLEFLDVPESDPVRNHAGIYRSYLLGPTDQRVKLILLDARWFRDELEPNGPNGNRYQANPDGDILGEEQWAWLEAELQANEASFHIIASGIQILPDEQLFEKWSNFPTAQQRLFDLIASTPAQRILLLSGDRHISEVSRMDLTGLAYPLYEFTSSGLTHSYEQANEPNRFRESPLVSSRSFGLLRFDWSQANAPGLTVEIRGIDGTLVYENAIF